jgi:hypothetical protein
VPRRHKAKLYRVVNLSVFTYIPKLR